uniref:Uncharacterized protein n=1 Tax=Anguilla anguilla TaxID=7936 RepID=A0A0E9UQE1_ANGAN
MMLSRYREALEDSQQAVRLDDCFMKGSSARGEVPLVSGKLQGCQPLLPESSRTGTRQ